MGKTTIGDFFKDTRDYEHFDFEAKETSENLHKDTNGFIDKISQGHSVVVTWGFQPYWHYQHVRRLINNGFKLIWFDGNRTIAYREYMRTKGDGEAFYRQLNNITSSRIIDLLKPKIIDTFINGVFRDKEEIVNEIEVYLNGNP